MKTTTALDSRRAISCATQHAPAAEIEKLRGPLAGLLDHRGALGGVLAADEVALDEHRAVAVAELAHAQHVAAAELRQGLEGAHAAVGDLLALQDKVPEAEDSFRRAWTIRRNRWRARWRR